MNWKHYTELRSGGLGYEAIGVEYTASRSTEPTWETRLRSLVMNAHWVVNIGAGTGSYESAHPRVVAVEPSPVMRRQRPPWAAPCVNARAESLPFDDDSFDVAMAILTIHHWSDLTLGLRELRRVARRYVILTYDMSVQRNFWLTTDYIPEIAESEQQRVPPIDTVVRLLGRPSRVEPLPVPADCKDGFVTAYWQRPWSLLEPSVRESCSALALTDPRAVDRGLRALRQDLESSAWHRKHHDLLTLQSWDAGFRLISGPL